MRPPERKRIPSLVVREDAEPPVKRSRRQAAKLLNAADDGDEIECDRSRGEPASPMDKPRAAAATAGVDEEQHKDLPATRARAGHARHPPAATTPAARPLAALCGEIQAAGLYGFWPGCCCPKP